ncbi:MAG: hypothetical protein EKK35_24325 [Bradyrhizobiaceae bacterium]|nr:MAG: hypothetical protein EKK35_24325 [Bradyrhizobiaceae bacterium]
MDLFVLRRVLMLRRCADGAEQKSGSHQANDAAPSDHKHHSGHDPGTTRDSGDSLSPQPPEKNADPNHVWLAAIVKKESSLERHRLNEFCAAPSEEEVAGIGYFATA